MYLDETTFNDGAITALEQQRDRSFGAIACFIEYPPASSVVVFIVVVVVVVVPLFFYLPPFVSCKRIISTH